MFADHHTGADALRGFFGAFPELVGASDVARAAEFETDGGAAVTRHGDAEVEVRVHHRIAVGQVARAGAGPDDLAGGRIVGVNVPCHRDEDLVFSIHLRDQRRAPRSDPGTGFLDPIFRPAGFIGLPYFFAGL